MSTRREFTAALSGLINDMIAAGEQPLIDYVLRSQPEQTRLFNAGLSGCDGINRLSQHQRGLAADLYLWNAEKKQVDYQWQVVKSALWHQWWVDKYGGNPLVTFGSTVDHPHFEM